MRKARRRNRAGYEVPAHMDLRAQRELDATANVYASELNEIEYAIGRPVRLGAVAYYDRDDSREKIAITFDGQEPPKDNEAAFLAGALWALRALSR